LSNLYVLKLNPTGTSLTYSALIGGAGASNIAVDAAGNAYVSASAGPFSPVTPGAIDQSCDAGALILKLSSTGSNLLTAAHLCPDRIWPVGVAVDSSQNIIFSANSDSADLPTTVGSLYPSKTNGCCFSDIVLGKLTGDGRALSYLTYFGGNSGDAPNGLAQDSLGNIFLAGFAASTNFPVRNGFQTTNAGGGDAFLSKLTLPSANLSVWPATLNFPTRGIGIASLVMDVTVANVSTGSIAISSVLSSGDFSVSSNGCGTQLAAGAHCVVAVGFNPQASGHRTGTLNITDGIGVQKVKLSGTGTSGPVISFPAGYQINTSSGVMSPPFPVTITNVGNQTLNITQISLTNGGAFNFSGSTNCFNPIAPLADCKVDVTYTGYGQDYSTLSFTDNASGTPQSFGLVGNVAGSGLIFTSAALRFGQRAVGTSSIPQQVTVINGTGSTVTINSIKSVGNFKETHNCHATLAAGAYCYINVTFKPSSIGIKQGSITVSNSASGSPLVLPLLGTGD
jgi:hypothetical protein